MSWLKFFAPGENISEEDHAYFQFEPRPTRSKFFLHIIEWQHLQYNHTNNLDEEFNDYELLAPEEPPEEPLEEESLVTSIDESP